MPLCYAYLLEAIEKHREALAVTPEISKAFDRVWQGSPLNKSSHLRYPSWLLQMGICFLRERSFWVVADGHISDSITVNGGVPQGPVLSTKLFLLHNNDLLKPPDYADNSTF